MSSSSRGRLLSSALAWRTFSASGVSSRSGSTRRLTWPREQVVEVLERRGRAARVAVLDGVARRGDVVDAVQQAEQPVDAVERPAPSCRSSARPSSDSRAPGVVPLQVVAQGQAVAVARGLVEQQLLDGGARKRQLRVIAHQPLDRRNRLVAEEAVGIAERGDERVHRRLRRDQRQRRGNVPAQPDVLVAVAQRSDRVRHDGLAVADQRVAGVGLQRPMAEQRHQAREKQAVGRAHHPGAADRLAHDARCRARGAAARAASGTGVVDVRERGGALRARPPPAASRRSAISRRSAASAASASAGSPLIGERRRGGDGHARLGVVEMAAASAPTRPRARARPAPAAAAARTSTSASCTIRSTAGVQVRRCGDARRRRAPSAPARRTCGDSWCSSSGVIRLRLSSASSIVDRVEHRRLVGVGQLLDQRLDRGGIGDVGADRVGRDHPGCRCCGGTTTGIRAAPPACCRSRAPVSARLA